MKIECPKCGGKGNVDDSKLPKAGTTVRCPRCSERFQIGLEPTATALPSFVSDEVESIPAVESFRREEPFSNSTVQEPMLHPASLERCSVCSKTLNRMDMIRFGETWVCSHCKPGYLQMLQQGIQKPGEMRYAGFWIRFGAKFIDGLALYALGFLAALPFAFAAGSEAGTVSLMSQIPTLVLQIVIPIVYTAYFIGKHRATPGKMACGLMVVMGDGGQVSPLRAVGRYFSEILSSLILCIGYVMSAFDEEKRSLHDRICDTRVVYK